MKKTKRMLSVLFLITMLLLSACAEARSDRDQSSPQGTTVDGGSTSLAVGTSASAIRIIADATSQGGIQQNNGVIADDYEKNLFERPFTEGEMAYQPDLDIVEAILASNDTHYFINITLNGLHPEGNLPGIYGAEIDTDLDGSGDLLILVESPAKDAWASAGVSVYRDQNNDVGGSAPMRPNQGYTGDGYEETVFSSEVNPDSAIAAAGWALEDKPAVSLAFQRSLIDTEDFVWGVWSAAKILSPDNLDLNDLYSEAEAGSPIPDSPYYPVGAINLVDNTCRNTSGFTPEENILGLCDDAYEDAPLATGSNFPVGLVNVRDDGGNNGDNGGDNSDNGGRSDGTGNLLVITFEDLNKNGSQDPNEPLTLNDDFTVNIYANTCDGPLVRESVLADVSIAGLEPGAYCIELDTGLNTITPSTQIVEVPENGEVIVDFGLDLLDPDTPPNLDPDDDGDLLPDVDLNLGDDSGSGLNLFP